MPVQFHRNRTNLGGRLNSCSVSGCLEPKSEWKWIGTGELAVNENSLTIVGQRHRYFWFAAKQKINVPFHQVCNVVAAGRLVKFEVKVGDFATERVEVVRLRTNSELAAQQIVAALPTSCTDEFESAHNEKLSFDRSIEQLGTQSTVTAALVTANIAWFLIVASQGGGSIVPQPGVIIQRGSNYGPLTMHGQWWRIVTSMFVHFGLLHCCSTCGCFGASVG